MENNCVLCHVMWVSTRKEKPLRFLEKVVLREAFPGNFVRNWTLVFNYHTISVSTCFYACIYFVIRFAYLAYYRFFAMLFSVSQLSIVNIFCYLCCIPGVYLKRSMLYINCVYCFLFSKTRLIAQNLTCSICGSMIFCDLLISI